MNLMNILSIINIVTNEAVDKWNEIIQSTMNSNPSKSYLSNDSYNSVDDPHGYLHQTLQNQEILNELNSNDIPNHILTLKVGDICLLMRSIAPDEGLTRNARVKIIGMQNRTVRVRKLSDGKQYTVHRITFKHKLPFGRSFEMLRKQLPLTLAYAITVNKAQGQTFNKQLFDLRQQSFAHGHLYVALSRIRNPLDILIFASDDQIENNTLKSITNIVYNELLFDVD